MPIQQHEIDKHNWFHAINFGKNLVSKGRFKNHTPPNWTLFGAYHFLENISLPGKKCLDIGTMDGIVPFILKTEGAAKVVATDVMNRQTFKLGQSLLNLDIDYMPDLSVRQIEDRVKHYNLFDLINMSGVIYHLYDPLSAIAICRKLMLNNGLLILESEVREGDESILYLKTAEDKDIEPFTYWVPTPKVMIEMLKFCCFEPLAIIKTAYRCTILSKAVKPSEISNRNRGLRSVHEQVRTIVPEDLDFKKLENKASEVSTISYSGTRETSEIFPEKFTTRFNLQPSVRH